MKTLSHALDRFFSTLFISFVRGYQVFIRPCIRILCLSVFGHYSECKQTPTCSEYTIFQIRNHGTITGLKKGALRIWNCHSL